tara:strand:- start:12662 stop:14314 length:1653 start_codon:yes stop_codon:yes gene_type:complete
VFLKKIYLYNFSLTTQIIIINIITAAIGLVFIFFANLFLLNNNKNFELQRDQLQIKIDTMNVSIEDIAGYLLTNSVFNIPMFNEESGEVILSLEQQLDPYSSQLYIEDKYLNKPYEIRIFSSDFIKYVDTQNIFINDEIIEIELGQAKDKQSLYNVYQDYYINFFNSLQKIFYRQKLKEKIEFAKNDIFFMIQSIKSQQKISKFYYNENNNLSYNISKPLIKNNTTYGAVIMKGYIKETNNEASIISLYLLNFFFIIIFFTFLLSIMFTRSIIRPIKTLSFLAKMEKDKLYKKENIIKYPLRKDEIGALSQEIKNLSKDLKDKINELQNFSADVAHELKNPLTSIKSSSELLSINKIGEENKKLLFINIEKELGKMDKLISDITHYTRTNAEIEEQSFGYFDIIRFTKVFFNNFLENNKNIKIKIDFEQDEIYVKANESKLSQVFINLIENAISFSPLNSSIYIKVEKKDQKTVIIFFCDQGPGIEYKLKDKIFNRFYTDRNEKNEQHSGLGLSISKKIIESFGGYLELCENNQVGYKGACFKLKLNIKD